MRASARRFAVVILTVLCSLVSPLVLVSGPPTAAQVAGGAESAAVPGAGTFRSPLPGGAHVVTPFDPPEHDWLSGHRGVDLAGQVGGPVLAPASGTVVFAGMLAGRPVVSMDHAGGLRTTYEPVDPVIRAGDSVTPGSALGSLRPGHVGCPEEACLHWGARFAGRYIDPMTLLAAADRPLRLKPLQPGDGV